MEEQFSAVDIVHNEIQFLVGLERVVKLDQERMIQLHEDAFLVESIHKFVPFNNPLLVELLHRINLPGSLVLHLHHFTKTTCLLKQNEEYYTQERAKGQVYVTSTNYRKGLKVTNTH